MRKKGDDGKREAMARVARNCNPDWWVFTLECAQEIARRWPYFTSDQVEELRRSRQGPSTHELRAWGPLMNAAATLGYCIPTVDWAPSMQRGCHGRPKRVWWSLLFAGPVRFRMPRRRTLDPRHFYEDDDDI